MKTGIITDEVSQDIWEAAKFAKQHGLNSIEIRSVDGKNSFQMEKEDFENIRRVADEFGLVICCVASPFFKCSLNVPSEIEHHLESLHRLMDYMPILGTKLIRGFTFWNTGNGKADFSCIASYFERVKRIIKPYGVTMAIESEPSVNTSNMALLAEFLKLVNDDSIRALWDPGNEICDLTAPPPYPVGYECLKPYICHIHIKDMKRAGGSYVPALIGKGDVDFGSIFERLRADGYSGYSTLETHYRILATMDEDLLRQPQGSQFSEGGREASSACLEVLKERYSYAAGGENE